MNQSSPPDSGHGDHPGMPHNGRRIVRNGWLNLGGHMLFALLQFVVVFVLARQLGMAGLGDYYTLITMMLIVQLIFESGMGTVLTMRIAQSPDIARQQIAEASGMFTVISVVSALVILLLGGGWFLSRNAVNWYPAVLGTAVACSAIQWQRFAAGVFQASEIFVYENLAKVLQVTLYLLGLTLLVISDASNLNTAIVALAVSHVLAAVFLLWRLARQCDGIGWQFDLRIADQWGRRALPLGWGDVLRTITWQLDTIGLAIFTSPVQVGTYSLAYRPLGPLNWIPRAMLAAAFPTVTRHAKTHSESTCQAFATSTRLLLVMGIPLAIGLFFAAEPLIHLLVGEQFRASVGLLQVLIWVIILSFVSQQFRFFLTAVHLHRYFAVLVAMTLALKVALLLWLAPTYGAFGACLGTLVSEAIFTCVGLALCVQVGIARIDWKLFGRLVISAAIMSIVAWFGRELDLILLIPWLGLATVVYLVACYGQGVFGHEECDYVEQVRHQIARRLKPLSSAVFGNRTP